MAPITPLELTALHEKLCEEGCDLMQRKNADYGANSDPFANFRMAGLLHVRPELGIMLRMQDKMARLVSFIEKGTLAVKEEGWHDCVIDLINYSVLLHGLLAEQALLQQPPAGIATIRQCSLDDLAALVSMKEALEQCRSKFIDLGSLMAADAVTLVLEKVKERA